MKPLAFDKALSNNGAGNYHHAPRRPNVPKPEAKGETAPMSYRTLFTALPQEACAYTPEVKAFIERYKLGALLAEARLELEKSFEQSLDLGYSLESDPEDGSLLLYVNIFAEELSEARRKINVFRYDWWYDQVGRAGDLVGFRPVKPGGL